MMNINDDYVIYLKEEEIVFIEQLLKKQEKNELIDNILYNIEDVLEVYPI